MSQFAIFVQEGWGTDAQTVLYSAEPPVYEAEMFPVFARLVNLSGETSERLQVGEREEMFVVVTPLNGPAKRRDKPNRIPFQRVLAVVPVTLEREEG